MAIKLKVKPKLPDNPKFLDRVEYALEWWIYCVIIDLPEKPAISALLTGVLVGLPFILIMIIILLFHFWK